MFDGGNEITRRIGTVSAIVTGFFTSFLTFIFFVCGMISHCLPWLDRVDKRKQNLILGGIGFFLFKKQVSIRVIYRKSIKHKWLGCCVFL